MISRSFTVPGRDRNNTEMKTFTPIILIVLSIGLFFFFVSPKYSTVRSLIDERLQYASAMDSIEEVKMLRDDLEIQLSSMPRATIDRLNRLVPQNINTVRLAADINTVGSSRGLNLINLRVNEDAMDNSGAVAPVSSKPYRSATISLSVTAPYTGFVAFLEDLEQSLQLINVKSVNFRTASREGNDYQFDLVVETYWIE